MSALYGFAYADAALKYLETSVSAKIRGQIKRIIESLATNANPPGSKKLQTITDGEAPVFRVRSGDYRILYVIRNNPDQIVVLDIGHRKDVYR